MKNQTALTWLIIPIFFLSMFAAGMGLFYQFPGESMQYETLRGEQVTINMQGLYWYDTVSSAAQMQGNDLITLVVGLPLLVVSGWLAFRGSLRGRLLLTGTLGFFLYTYLSMSMLTAFNALFLIYVLIFGMSLYAFILSMLSFDLTDLPGHFPESLPRKWMAGFMFAVGGFLTLAWLKQILTPLLQNTPPLLENTTTMVIQAMDLALVIPLAILAGVLLIKRNAWGYLLSSIFILKSIALGLAISTMGINMTMKGIPDSLGMLVPFLMITIINLGMAGTLLKSIDGNPLKVTH
jgi:hypothetical protein